MKTIAESIKRLYNNDKLTVEQVSSVVVNGKITQDEYNEILGDNNPDINIQIEIAYRRILNKYDEAINYGVFALDDTYFANMSWYNTWTRVKSLYESDTDGKLGSTFSVRLYKKIDGIYYNYNVTHDLASFKDMLNTLNNRQFLLYQPIRTQLLTALQKAKTDMSVDELNAISVALETAFGDIINETNEYIEDSK